MMTKLLEFVRRMSVKAKRQLPPPPTGKRWRIAPPGDMPLAADPNTFSIRYELLDEPTDQGAAAGYKISQGAKPVEARPDRHLPTPPDGAKWERCGTTTTRDCNKLCDVTAHYRLAPK